MSSAFRRGQQAEQRGDYYKAYVIYCQAARTKPSSRLVKAALTRVTPLAAQHWLGVGREFERRNQYDLAWRSYVRSLLIYPGNASVLAGIRRLEREHPDRVVASKNAWWRYGERSLYIGRIDFDVRPSTHVLSADVPPVSSTGGQEEKRDRESFLHAAGPRTNGPPATIVGTASMGTEPATTTAARTGPAETEPPTVTGKGPPKTEEKRDQESFLHAAGPRANGPPETEPPTTETTALPPDDSGRTESGFLTTAVASRNDKRFRKTVSLPDDIRVRILDTDDDPDADISIYLGRRRVRKVRNWRVGESVRITGRSGRCYEIEIISIYDPTESVRIGIRGLDPASNAS